MKLDQLLSWVKARFVSMRRETPQHAQDSARLKREARAHTVTDLQSRVRALQQQITDISARAEQGGAGANSEAERKTLAELEDQLAKTQAELARYQGRI